MFWVNVNSSKTPKISVELTQSLLLSSDFSKLKIPEYLKPATVDKRLCREIVIEYSTDMDPKTKKLPKPKIVPMPPFLVNNPNISIIPATNRLSPSTLQMQPSVSNINRIPLSVPVSPPVSLVPVKNQETTKCNDFNDSKNSFKRNAPNPISNKPVKMPRLTISGIPKRNVDPVLIDSTSKLNSPNKTNNKLKKIDPPPNLAINNATSLIPSTSSVTTRVPQESTSQPNTIESSNLGVNHDSDSALIEACRMPSGIEREYIFCSDGKFKINHIRCTQQDDASPQNDLLLLQSRRELIKIERPDMMKKITVAIRMAMKELASKEEFDSFLKNNSYFIQPPEHESPSETKDAPSTKSKLNPANHNNVSNNKSQSTNQIKTQRVNQQLPCSSKHSIPNIQLLSNNKQTNSSNIQPTIKKNDLKHNVSNVIQPMATVTQIQSVNKQITGHQLPTTSKNTTVVSVNSPVTCKKVIGLSQSKPVDSIKCSKCGILSEFEICTSCQMSSKLKDVTVTRIETPSVRPNESNATIEIISSSSEFEDDDCSEELNINEPTIYIKETDDTLNKFIERLCSNPKILEEKLWNKELGVKDYFKFESCKNVQIGNYETVACGDMFICLYGIRMVINNFNSKPVTIDLPIDNITKIFGYFDTKPIFIFYTTHLFAVGIRFLLDMNDNSKTPYFDPLSEDFKIRNILWTFEFKNKTVQHLKKLLLKFQNNKFEPLTLAQAKYIRRTFLQSSNSSEMETKPQSQMTLTEYQNVVIFSETFANTRVDVKIFDYNTLNVEEFINDKLVEFHLNYWYEKMLTPDNHRRTFVFSTYFYTKLVKKRQIGEPLFGNAYTRFQRVRKWTKNVNIFEKDYIFIPVNENHHWYLVVICFPYLDGPVLWDGTPAPEHPTEDEELIDRSLKGSCDTTDLDEADGNTEELWFFHPEIFNNSNGSNFEDDVRAARQKRIGIKQPCILVLDSLSGGVNRARIVATIRSWLSEEYREKYNGSTKDFSKSIVKSGLVNVPQQSNFSDCGLYVMHFFEKFFQNPIVDYTFPIIHLENWFHPNEVSLNAQKRREIQRLILSTAEKCKQLPPGIDLPVINFTPRTIQINCHNNSQFLNQNMEDDLEGYIDNEDDEVDDDDDDDVDDDCRYEQFPSSGYIDYDSEHDQSEGGEVNEPWSQERPQDEDYHSEQDSDDNDQFHDYHSNNDNIVVDSCTTNNRRHLRNSQHDDLRSYASNFQTNDDGDDDDDDYDVDEEDDDSIEYDDEDNGVNDDDSEDNDE